MDDVVRSESTFDLPHAAADLWTILSKTGWINQSLGLPPVQYEAKPAIQGGSEIKASASLFGLALEWTENPFEWSEPEFYQVLRVFHGGPWAEALMGMRFVPVAPKQTRVTVHSRITPRNVLGSLLAKSVVAPKSTQDLQKLMLHASQHLSNRVEPMLPNLPTTPNREETLHAGLKQLQSSPAPAELLRRFELWLRHSPDAALTHVRPWVVAREWTAEKWKVLAVFLEATRAGLLEFRWELLCPQCRTSRQEHVRRLDSLPSTSHCDVCQVRFEAHFDQSVELKFSVHPNVRPVPNAIYCLAGPGNRPHIISQTTVPPSSDLEWSLRPTSERVRLRSPQVPGSIEIDPELLEADGGVTVRADARGFALARAQSKRGTALLQNRLPHAVQFVFERIAWSHDILTAAQVTNWQEFRDLFPAETLSPHEQFALERQVVVFTNLKGTTALCHEIGDAQAYGIVRDHLTALQTAVRDQHGTVVKVAGDSVMAVFSTLEQGLNAVESMHRKITALTGQPRQSIPLQLKSSIHAGSCQAVHANGKLDYFGATINFASRMAGCSNGQDLIVADAILHQSEVAQWISKRSTTPEPLELRFSGFEHPAKVWRVRMG